jgi:hypothetical protein
MIEDVGDVFLFEYGKLYTVDVTIFSIFYSLNTTSLIFMQKSDQDDVDAFVDY